MQLMELFGWASTLLLWSSFLPKNRFYLHLIGVVASSARLVYILMLYFSGTGDLARPLIANWSMQVIIHTFSLYRFRKEVSWEWLLKSKKTR